MGGRFAAALELLLADSAAVPRLDSPEGRKAMAALKLDALEKIALRMAERSMEDELSQALGLMERFSVIAGDGTALARVQEILRRPGGAPSRPPV
jgi:hypothetical protein